MASSVSSTSSKILHFLKPVFAVVIGLTLGLLVTHFAGENPWHVFQILVHSAFGSGYDIGMTLFYSTPLIFTGLAVAFSFHAGLFNIGAEGQLTVGAFAAAAFASLFPHVPWFFAAFLAGTAAIAAGFLWGAIPGWLRAKRGAHEVINTIMLNFIAAGLTSWGALYLLPNPNSQNPETAPIGINYQIPHLGSFFGDAPVSYALPVALLTAFVFWFFLWKTVWGFEIRAVGQSESAARAAGMSASRIRILSLAISGGLAGMVGIAEVLGHAGRFKVGFSPGYGFIGIAVALLGRGRPVGIVLSAILFGALHKGATDLDLETENVTRDISSILQGMVILCVSADGLWSFLGARFKKKKIPASSRTQEGLESAEAPSALESSSTPPTVSSKTSARSGSEVVQ